jgi:DNA polymerase-3 subunit delta'
MARAPAVFPAPEADPEADRLEGAPHPRHTAALFGHDGPESLLAEATAAGRLHHGWLIAGPAGIGKATLAYRMAKHLLAAPDERDPFARSLAVGSQTRAARQVDALSHPDLLVLRRPYDPKTKKFAGGVTVDEVRRLKSFLAHAADGWRVVIVDTADDLNPNAANALLKSLEEPPRRTVFLLVASEPGRLLPTIRSRCRRLDLGPLAPDDLRRAVTAALAAGGGAALAEDVWRELDTLAEGSVRRALTIAASGGLALHERVVKLVSLLPRVDWPAVHTLGDELSGVAAADKADAFFDFLIAHLARLVRARTTGTGRPADMAQAERLIRPDAVPRWVDAWGAIEAAKAEADLLNLDRKALILTTVAKLEALAR